MQLIHCALFLCAITSLYAGGQNSVRRAREAHQQRQSSVSLPQLTRRNCGEFCNLFDGDLGKAIKRTKRNRSETHFTPETACLMLTQIINNPGKFAQFLVPRGRSLRRRGIVRDIPHSEKPVSGNGLLALARYALGITPTVIR